MQSELITFSTDARVRWRIFSVSFVCIWLFFSSGCDRYSVKPKCSDDLTARDLDNFSIAPNGTAFNQITGLTWYRCLAGASFKGDGCQGAGLLMNWNEANRFAVDLSEKSGVNWRLATEREMQDLVQPSCNNPAFNTTIFSAIGTVNLWTSSSSWKHRSDYACTMYSYNGALSCKQPKETLHPFLLVTEQKTRF